MSGREVVDGVGACASEMSWLAVKWQYYHDLVYQCAHVTGDGVVMSGWIMMANKENGG